MKIVSTTISGEVMIFNTWEDYCSYQYKLCAETFDNAFDTNYKPVEERL